MTALERGAEVIRAFARTLPHAPGVYRMLSASGDVLYVGKARALKKRVLNYTQTSKLPLRLQRMVSETADMMFVVTHTEVEALLLESNLIKKLKPRYNIQLRDGKSFSYILITGDHDYPQLLKYRGTRDRKGQYFGPFASTGAVNRTVTTLQRAFMLRTCSDSVFAQRTRPCLQYHIKRCTAPCVEKVTQSEYAHQVDQARAFMAGKSSAIHDDLVRQMQDASDGMDFETAARFRDRIRALTAIQSRQDINIAEVDDADVIAIVQREGKSCIQAFFFRGGHNYGNRAYFPRHEKDEPVESVLMAFLEQFYADKPAAQSILVNLSLEADDVALLEEALSARENSGKIRITCPERGPRKRLIDFVTKNAAETLAQHLLEKAGDAVMLNGVASLFGMEEPPRRIEVYDNSHISGTDMVGGMIVAGPEGFMKKAYRKFNIKQADAADDYGMMREVMTRRFRRVGENNFGPGAEDWPDLLLIDGGQGQLNAVYNVLVEMGIAGQVHVVGIAKGEDRNAGREKFFIPGRAMFQLPEKDPVLHYLQRLRDEAHRYAIGSHRARRVKRLGVSPLDSVPGVGARRKKALLLHFGSAQAVAQAGIDELERVEGISHSMATIIYRFFHDQ